MTCSGSGSDDCDSCEIGFYVDANGYCSLCDIDYCLSCSPISPTEVQCDTCQLGYVYNPTIE